MLTILFLILIFIGMFSFSLLMFILSNMKIINKTKDKKVKGEKQ